MRTFQELSAAARSQAVYLNRHGALDRAQIQIDRANVYDDIDRRSVEIRDEGTGGRHRA